MAEYSLAAVINLERRFKLALELQNKKSWSIRRHICFWRSTSRILLHFSPELKGYRCLSELTVGILGVGQIGQCTANLLRGDSFHKRGETQVRMLLQLSDVRSSASSARRDSRPTKMLWLNISLDWSCPNSYRPWTILSISYLQPQTLTISCPS